MQSTTDENGFHFHSGTSDCSEWRRYTGWRQSALACLHRQMRACLRSTFKMFLILVLNMECLPTSDPALMTYSATPPFGQRVCACLLGSEGNVGGDPHIHSLRGARYTLLQQGVFVAWNFSKPVAAPSAAPAAARGWQRRPMRATASLPKACCSWIPWAVHGDNLRLLLACEGEEIPMAQGTGRAASGRRRDHQPPSEEAARETR